MEKIKMTLSLIVVLLAMYLTVCMLFCYDACGVDALLMIAIVAIIDCIALLCMKHAVNAVKYLLSKYDRLLMNTGDWDD